MESKPIKTIPIHDHLRGKLCDLYENDCIFDKFECVWGGDDKYVLCFYPLPQFHTLCLGFQYLAEEIPHVLIYHR
jgi:hypothetical protein